MLTLNPLRKGQKISHAMTETSRSETPTASAVWRLSQKLQLL
jgi:hypothetical protein